MALDLPPVRISSGRDKTSLLLPVKHAEDAKGIKITSIRFSTHNDEIAVGDMIVESPKDAAQYIPFFGALNNGTHVHAACFWGGKAFISIPSFSPRLLSEDNLVVWKDGLIGIDPSSISPETDIDPVEAKFADDEYCFIAKDASHLTPVRSLRNCDLSNVTRRRLWRFGSKKPDEGCLYVRTSDTPSFPPLDRKSEALALAEMRKEFPWADKSDLARPRAKLEQHDLYIRAQDEGWKSHVYNENTPETILFKVAKEFFSDDSEVFRSSPFHTDILYRQPSIQTLKSIPAAYDAYFAKLIAKIPHFADIASDPETPGKACLHLLTA